MQDLLIWKKQRLLLWPYITAGAIDWGMGICHPNCVSKLSEYSRWLLDYYYSNCQNPVKARLSAFTGF